MSSASFSSAATAASSGDALEPCFPKMPNAPNMATRGARVRQVPPAAATAAARDDQERARAREDADASHPLKATLTRSVSVPTAALASVRVSTGRAQHPRAAAVRRGADAPRAGRGGRRHASEQHLGCPTGRKVPGTAFTDRGPARTGDMASVHGVPTVG